MCLLGGEMCDSTPTGAPMVALRKIIVTNFEDGGIVYCKDANNVVYDMEDAYFDVRPARPIGRCVDGAFVPYDKTTDSSLSPPDSAKRTTVSLPDRSTSASL